MGNQKSQLSPPTDTTPITTVLDTNQVSLSELSYLNTTIIEYRHYGIIKFFSMTCPEAKCIGIRSTDIQNWISHMKNHENAKWNQPQSDLSTEEICLMFSGQRIDAPSFRVRAWIVEQCIKQKEEFRDYILNLERTMLLGEESTLHSEYNGDLFQAGLRETSSQSTDHATSQAPQYETQPPLSSLTTAPPGLLKTYTPPTTQFIFGVLMIGGFWYYGFGFSAYLSIRIISQFLLGLTGSFVLFQGTKSVNDVAKNAFQGCKNMVEQYKPSSSSPSFADHCAQNGSVNSDGNGSNVIVNERVAEVFHQVFAEK